MPKAKPTQVIVHRIELQETERDTLEAALAGSFVTNGVSAIGSVFSGIGSALAPFRDIFTALGALWIADKTLEELTEVVTETYDHVTDFFFPQIKSAPEMYGFIVAWLDTFNNDWGRMFSKSYEVDDHLRANKRQVYYFLFTTWKAFIRAMEDQWRAPRPADINGVIQQSPKSEMMRHGIVGMWTRFYSMDDFNAEINEKGFSVASWMAGA